TGEDGADTSPRETRAGFLIDGRYRVERVLGRGGGGMVVEAFHAQLSQKVAIKFLARKLLQNPEMVARFENEARAAAQIRGEHVVDVRDVGRMDGGLPFMVMEYLEGVDVYDRLQREGPLPIDEAVEIGLQVCEGLAEAHALGIVHRDLKP